MKCYKILDRSMEYYDGFNGSKRWSLGEWKEADKLDVYGSPGGFRGYEHPLLAVLHNPIHSNIIDPRLFEAEADGEIVRDGQMELKSKRMRITKEIPVPEVSTAQRVAYAIYCAKRVFSVPKWDRYVPKWYHWADAWLRGEDRSEQAAQEAVKEANAAWASVWEAGEYMSAREAAAAECAAQAAEAASRGANEGSARLAAQAALAAARAGCAALIACAERAMMVGEIPKEK